ncbi:hypothetical protein [Klebsiella michiganensis]|uniref:hypothetical protein n=1 Tax=Klebsiella michiganensis TaxID=1134687 RepID=UPI001F14B4AF|nr:hypothetical protein [Klebsiella michiganensis]
MTKSTITRERIKQYAHDPHMCNVNEEIRELACMALTALDSEPVAGEARFKEEHPRWTPCTAEHVSMVLANPEDWPNYEVRYLYAAPQPAPELTATVERLNASGYEYEGGEVTPQNVAAVVDILLQQLDGAVQGRDTQPAPVVMDEMLCKFYEVNSWHDLVRELVKHVEQLQDSARRNVKPWEDTFPETLLPAYIERIKQADDACRAAMLQAAPVRSSMPDGVVTAEHRRVIEMLLSVCGAAFELADDSCQQDVDGEECHVVPSDAFQKLSDALDEIENTLPTEDNDRPDVFLAWSAMPRTALKSLLQAGYSPVIPEGYVMVPKEPTERMVIDGFESEPDETFSEPEVWEAFQKMRGCEQAAFRARLCWAAMLAAVPPAPTQENI